MNETVNVLQKHGIIQFAHLLIKHRVRKFTVSFGNMEECNINKN